MNGIRICLAGSTPALDFAGKYLKERGGNITDIPDKTVTHLLLPVPSFTPSGDIIGGGNLADVLSALPSSVTVIGGNIPGQMVMGYQTLDLLRDEMYLSENAAITADCALGILISKLPVTLPGCPVLIIGWGRIGQCLAARLKALGADVTVAARKEQSRANAVSLGYGATDIRDLGFALIRYRAILNTAPAPVLSESQIAHCRPDCVKLDLASVKGIAGDDVIWARGLPGKLAPETSGRLIAKTTIRLLAGKETPL